MQILFKFCEDVSSTETSNLKNLFPNVIFFIVNGMFLSMLVSNFPEKE
ncbi:hypothetical protein ACQPUS_04285 [Clostridium butyricum]